MSNGPWKAIYVSQLLSILNGNMPTYICHKLGWNQRLRILSEDNSNDLLKQSIIEDLCLNQHEEWCENYDLYIMKCRKFIIWKWFNHICCLIL